MLNEDLINKWQPVLDHSDLPPIKEHYRKVVTAHMLEAQENSLREQATMQGTGSASLLGEAAPETGTGSMTGFDPVLISLVRRTAPNLIAFDIMGVQPMSGPTGLIFALRPKYGTDNGAGAIASANAFIDEANTAFSAGGGDGLSLSASQGLGGAGTTAVNNFLQAVSTEQDFAAFSQGALTATGEAFGDSAVNPIPSMTFAIDKTSVTARSRALKAEYSVELAQDLKAIHGLDAETELANILTTEINAEINRDIIRSVYFTSTFAGTVDARGAYANAGGAPVSGQLDGRWMVERFKSLVFKVETEANTIAKQTRRGKGNFIICSSDVASAFATAGVLDPTAALTVDDTGSTFAGTMGAGIKVYIDPYTHEDADFLVVGYKGTSPFDAGMFYCPYVPLQMVRAVGENTFQPKIGFKTRYGVGVNPFATDQGVAGRNQNTSNKYYRGVVINNLFGIS